MILKGVYAIMSQKKSLTFFFKNDGFPSSLKGRVAKTLLRNPSVNDKYQISLFLFSDRNCAVMWTLGRLLVTGINLHHVSFLLEISLLVIFFNDH